MSVQEQLIDDIKQLPEHTLHLIRALVRELVVLSGTKKSGAESFEKETKQNPRIAVFGSGRGMMLIADDFDAPLEELKEYME